MKKIEKNTWVLALPFLYHPPSNQTLHPKQNNGLAFYFLSEAWKLHFKQRFTT